MNEIEAKMIVAFVRCDMKITHAAKRIHYDTSTLEYRFNSVHIKTGLNPRNFFDLNELYAIACNVLGDKADEI